MPRVVRRLPCMPPWALATRALGASNWSRGSPLGTWTSLLGIVCDSDGAAQLLIMLEDHSLHISIARMPRSVPRPLQPLLWKPSGRRGAASDGGGLVGRKVVVVDGNAPWLRRATRVRAPSVSVLASPSVCVWLLREPENPGAARTALRQVVQCFAARFGYRICVVTSSMEVTHASRGCLPILPYYKFC